MPMPFFDSVVFGGGGINCAAYLGCVRALEAGPELRGAPPGSDRAGAARIRVFAGTSAGAIAAFLCALGMGASDMEAWLARHLRSGALTSLDVDGLLALPERLCLDTGERVEECLLDALRWRLGPAARDATFLELAKATGNTLVVCATDLSAGREALFSVEATPDVSVLTALRMSSAVPVLFAPVRFRGRLYVDGGLVANLPLGFRAAVGPVAVRQVLAVSVGDHPLDTWMEEWPAEEVEAGGPGITAYLWRVIVTLLWRAQSGSVAHDAGDAAVTRVHLRTCADGGWMSFSATDMCFRLGEEDLARLARLGEESMAAELLSRRRTAARGACASPAAQTAPS